MKRRDRDRLRDLDYRLKVTPGGTIQVVTGSDVIKQSIKAIISTIPGERVRLPEFGSYVYAMLFEPMSPSTARAIARSIETAIERFEDRVTINQIDVNPDYDNSTYHVQINYSNLVTGRRDSMDATMRAMGG